MPTLVRPRRALPSAPLCSFGARDTLWSSPGARLGKQLFAALRRELKGIGEADAGKAANVQRRDERADHEPSLSYPRLKAVLPDRWFLVYGSAPHTASVAAGGRSSPELE